MAHKLDQQRAIFRPTKSTAFFDDDDDDFSDYLTTDDTSSMARSLASSIEANSMRSDTLALAEFLTSTSPEEFAKPSLRKQHQRRASRILTRLRKRPTRGSLQTDNSSVISKGSNSNQHQAKHIPLPSYQPPSLRDSGVYSEISDKDVQHYLPPPPVPPVPQTQQQPMHNDLQMFPMPPPTVPAKSSARPQRPAPLPEDVASAAIAAASQQYQHHDLRSVPPAALKRRSIVRNRHHVQVQSSKEATDEAATSSSSTHNAPSACPHCRQHIGAADKKQDDGTNARRPRRLSSPPAMASGVLQQKHSTATPDHNTLRQMIERLEAQLAEERQSRQKLEQVMLRNNHQATRKMEQVAEERSRWKDDCQWMQNRIASMSQ
ncbi:hypothetical protein O0I10_000209 [Lichtheimia ornata]|uniref:Uncharacterized protein n=1 Tax=Lichtheimia ornata TaxID=688661 RepID=A0AAD7Y548_9FUNG|nr:uncharacterized protein O0I10_000209 [Lichtheimia ornata]KAJ8663934.1 hypothetical protein O0I10_000209 [Lichtheimia ornata]